MAGKGSGRPGPQRTPWQDRFWAKVDASGGVGACWPWMGSLSKGHGKFVKNMGDSNVPECAHRLAYELCIGPIPGGLDVDHHCHNEDLACQGGVTCPHRACCNPAHLRAKTRGDNVRAGRTGEATAARNRARAAAKVAA